MAVTKRVATAEADSVVAADLAAEAEVEAADLLVAVSADLRLVPTTEMTLTRQKAITNK